MLERRQLIAGGFAAGLTSLGLGEPAAAAAQRSGESEVAQELSDLRRLVDQRFEGGSWGSIAQIRQHQRTWLRATQKFPDFIEIGIGVWEGIYDWHVKHQQPLNVTRLGDGRYTMALNFTTLLLRADQAPEFIGYPFDAQTR